MKVAIFERSKHNKKGKNSIKSGLDQLLAIKKDQSRQAVVASGRKR